MTAWFFFLRKKVFVLCNHCVYIYKKNVNVLRNKYIRYSLTPSLFTELYIADKGNTKIKNIKTIIFLWIMITYLQNNIIIGNYIPSCFNINLHNINKKKGSYYSLYILSYFTSYKLDRLCMCDLYWTVVYTYLYTVIHKLCLKIHL